jgi:hypothetical protein
MLKVDFHFLKPVYKVLSIELPISNEYRRECIQEIEKIGDQQNKSTNVKGLMTSWKIFEQSNQFNNLIEQIADCISEVHNTPKKRFSLAECWGSIFEKEDYADEHDHLGKDYSFVYYLEVEEGASDIVFTKANYKIPINAGKLLVFPSHMVHSVPPTKGRRVILAGNLNIIK